MTAGSIVEGIGDEVLAFLTLLLAAAVYRSVRAFI
jgi:hypothetical protein